MSWLGDILIEQGPFIAGGIVPRELQRLKAADFNELRDEIIDGRSVIAHQERLTALTRDDLRRIELWRKRAIEAGWSESKQGSPRSPSAS